MDNSPRHSRQTQNNGCNDDMGEDTQQMPCQANSNERPLLESVILSIVTFIANVMLFFICCHKPDRREFKRNAVAVAAGILVVGSLGSILKLLQIPLILSSHQTQK